MLNYVSLMGRLAQDPELRTTTTGKSVATFDLAVPAQSKDKDAPADFFTIVCWNAQADFVSRYLSKGRQVVIAGRLKTRRYTGKDGKNYKVVEVIATGVYFADSNRSTPGGNEGTQPTQSGANEGAQIPTYAETVADYEEIIDDEDLPF